MEKFTLKNGVVVTLRLLEGADYKEAMAFLRQFSTETIFTNQYPGQPDIEKKETMQMYEDENNLFLGCFLNDGSLVGIISAYTLYPHHPWIGFSCDFGLSLLKTFYGQGLGTKLMQEMESWAKKRKLHTIIGTTHTTNRRAIALYLKSGFTVDGYFRETAFIDGKWHDDYHFSKILK